MFMGITEAYKHLTPHLPSASLVSVPVLSSVLGQVVIQFIFQIFIFFYIQSWDFYKPHIVDPNEEDANMRCYENSALFLFANFQYLVTCVAFSISKPFRQPLYSNFIFSVSLMVLLAFSIILVLSHWGWIYSVFGIMDDITLEFKVILLIVAVANSLATFLYEKIVVWHISLWWKNKKDKIFEEERNKELA